LSEIFSFNCKFIQNCHNSKGSTLTLIAHVVASLDKALYDDYLCLVGFEQAAN